MATSALKTQGVQLKRGNGGSPETFTLIGEVTKFDGPGGSANEIDATSLDSTAKEWLMGLQDEGEFTFEANCVPSNAQQAGLRTDRAAATLRNFKLLLTDVGPTTLSFAAYVKEYKISGGVDDKITLNVTLRISGAVTWA